MHNEDRRASGWSSGCALALNKGNTRACFTHQEGDASMPTVVSEQITKALSFQTDTRVFISYFLASFHHREDRASLVLLLPGACMSQRGDAGS